jgi:hypothetical protein
MMDKQWLERVDIAYTEYKKEIGPNLSIENFITWLYKQYGILQKDNHGKS